MISEISQMVKDKNCMISHICMGPKTKQSSEAETRVIRGWGLEEKGRHWSKSKTSRYKRNKFWHLVHSIVIVVNNTVKYSKVTENKSCVLTVKRKWQLCHVIQVLPHTILVFILHDVYQINTLSTSTILYVNYISVKLGKLACKYILLFGRIVLPCPLDVRYDDVTFSPSKMLAEVSIENSGLKG